jgi:hypothetical protein
MTEHPRDPAGDSSGIDTERRDWLRAAFLSTGFAALAAACGSSGSDGADSTSPSPGPGPTPTSPGPTPPSPGPGPTPPAPPGPVGQADAYRSTAPNLFVDARSTTVTVAGAGSYYEVPGRASVSGSKVPYELGKVGPSYSAVEQSGEWLWANPGGDWINQTGTPQGTANPHFTLNATSATSGSFTYNVNITAGVSAAFARGKWNAYIVRVSGATRGIATQRTATPPRVQVTYTDGSSAALECLACVHLMSGTSYTRTGANVDAEINPSVALEFQMPTKAVSSATMTITVTRHSSGSAAISGYLANPPVNTHGVTSGVAAAYPGDAGLRNHASILFAQRYEDGTTLGDYVIQNFSSVDTWNLDNWDPELFGTGPANPAKLPTAYQGVPIAGTHKWFYKQNSGGTVTLVNSSYTGDNFQPSAPGLGAMRIVIPKGTAADGGAVGYSGSLGSDLWALFPKAISGLVSETYVRFRVRFAFTAKLLADTKMFRSEAGSDAHYAIREGKWGLGTHHWTFYGGNNNVGGENIGHTNRLGFRVHPGDVGLMGMQSYVHSWDMIKYDMMFGREGGLGAGFYPNRWYWVEIRKKLNTWNSTGAVGTSPSDGLMEIFIDGRLAARHTNWKYRDGALSYGAGGDTPLNAGKAGALPPDGRHGALAQPLQRRRARGRRGPGDVLRPGRLRHPVHRTAGLRLLGSARAAANSLPQATPGYPRRPTGIPGSCTTVSSVVMKSVIRLRTIDSGKSAGRYAMSQRQPSSSPARSTSSSVISELRTVGMDSARRPPPSTAPAGFPSRY